MGKRPSPPKKMSLGKGKVTPVQIAFIVNRYLAENSFSSTLAAFHSEAAELFAKTKAKEAPKGLLSLADILDEYVTLKEQKIVVEQEKHRVEAVLRGINAAMDAYHSAASGARALPFPPQPSLPVSPIPPPTPGGVAVPTAPAASAEISPSDSIAQTPLSRSSPNLIPMHIKQPIPLPILPVNPPTGVKRKNSRPAAEPSAASKKQRHHLSGSGRNLSPSSGELTVSQVCASPTRQRTPSKCAVMSKRTIVVSPFKGQGGYIAVEKSVCISSPMKSSPYKTTRRESAKGRLDFDGADASTSSASPASSDEGMKELLDLDLSDFDIDFNVADLLVNIDLDCDEFPMGNHP